MIETIQHNQLNSHGVGVHLARVVKHTESQ